MVFDNIILHLLSDKNSLSDYYQGYNVDFDIVKMRLIMLDREENKHVPDQYYRMNAIKSLAGISSLSDLLRKGLFNLSSEFLDYRNHRIYVQQNKMNRWQKIITYIPPLLLQMAFLHIKEPLDYSNLDSILRYCEHFIKPNVLVSSLPIPFIPELSSFVESNKGLRDLHIHLNGTTEFDVVWQDCLIHSCEVCNAFHSSLSNKLVREQWEEETNWNKEIEIQKLLDKAKEIRTELFGFLFPTLGYKNSKTTSDNLFVRLFSDSTDNVTKCMQAEGLMYVMVFSYLCDNPREHVSSIFHHYLLIQGLINRLLVHQFSQNGFSQFQKVTLNEIRKNKEKSYIDRFFQLDGNDGVNINYIEGRFAPKDTEIECINLISTIENDWSAFCKRRYEANRQPAELGLVAHFVKKEDKCFSSNIRHINLRKSVWNKANVLYLLKKHYPRYTKHIVGIDAASNELDAPPEVFAPSFRYLRRHHFSHFTYHAGEDFTCLLGGMRAIYEAMYFNDLSYGDRIGHACAIGLSPQNWIDTIGDSILVKKGEYLDDLVFAYYQILSHKSGLQTKLWALSNRIQNLYYDIYKIIYPIDLIIKSWQCRKFCPILLLSKTKEIARTEVVFDEDEWSDIQTNIGESRINNLIVQSINLYHNAICKQNYNDIIQIDVDEIFNANDYVELQLMLLEDLHSKGIAIEALPTSNIRIGYYNNYDAYHLWNWFNWRREGHSIPPIVLGTDDPGIFATNIYNEYANIYCNLVHNQKKTRKDAIDIIAELEENARVYKFR